MTLACRCPAADPSTVLRSQGCGRRAVPSSQSRCESSGEHPASGIRLRAQRQPMNDPFHPLATFELGLGRTAGIDPKQPFEVRKKICLSAIFERDAIRTTSGVQYANWPTTDLAIGRLGQEHHGLLTGLGDPQGLRHSHIPARTIRSCAVLLPLARPLRKRCHPRRAAISGRLARCALPSEMAAKEGDPESRWENGFPRLARRLAPPGFPISHHRRQIAKPGVAGNDTVPIFAKVAQTAVEGAPSAWSDV
jgi:hypothetical protein